MGKNTQFTLFLFICSIYCFYSMCIRYGLISFIEITASLLTLLPIHFKQMKRHLSSRINENQLSTPTTICWHICFRLIYNSIKWHRWHQSTNNILNNRRHFFCVWRCESAFVWLMLNYLQWHNSIMKQLFSTFNPSPKSIILAFVTTLKG